VQIRLRSDWKAVEGIYGFTVLQFTYSTNGWIGLTILNFALEVEWS
jgi:hypothetical protein